MMRFKNSKLGFVTYLPEKGECPLETADLEIITHMDSASSSTDVYFSMPKFEMESNYSLNDVL